jgi:hypothetical protein
MVTGWSRWAAQPFQKEIKMSLNARQFIKQEAPPRGKVFRSEQRVE